MFNEGIQSALSKFQTLFHYRSLSYVNVRKKEGRGRVNTDLEIGLVLLSPFLSLSRVSALEK